MTEPSHYSCARAALQTDGLFTCTRPGGHEGPCAAKQVPYTLTATAHTADGTAVASAPVVVQDPAVYELPPADALIEAQREYNAASRARERAMDALEDAEEAYAKAGKVLERALQAFRSEREP